MSLRSRTSPAIDCEAAVASSTSAAFCWVSSSICTTARLTCSIPEDCSREAAAISATMSETFFTEVTISPSVRPDWVTRPEPSSTFLTLSSIRLLISLAAVAERPARLRTSLATTAKPRPCSPARAASTAALSASRLVWKAISSMTPMMSAIFFAESSIPDIASTALPTTAPPCSA